MNLLRETWGPQKTNRMATNLNLTSKKVNQPQKPLRAILEICGGELVVYPVANSDTEERTILDALRFVVEHGAAR